jgi:hypothetical protein
MVAAAVLFSPMPSSLAQEVPAGTVMPVMLQTTLNAKRASVGVITVSALIGAAAIPVTAIIPGSTTLEGFDP